MKISLILKGSFYSDLKGRRRRNHHKLQPISGGRERRQRKSVSWTVKPSFIFSFPECPELATLALPSPPSVRFCRCQEPSPPATTSLCSVLLLRKAQQSPQLGALTLYRMQLTPWHTVQCWSSPTVPRVPCHCLVTSSSFFPPQVLPGTLCWGGGRTSSRVKVSEAPRPAVWRNCPGCGPVLMPPHEPTRAKCFPMGKLQSRPLSISEHRNGSHGVHLIHPWGVTLG